MKKKKINKLLDKEWGKNVLARDNYICQVCKKKGNQPHHIIPKMFRILRWEIDNGITLCYSCHIANRYSAHKNAIWFSNWLKVNKPIQYLKALLFLGIKE